MKLNEDVKRFLKILGIFAIILVVVPLAVEIITPSDFEIKYVWVYLLLPLAIGASIGVLWPVILVNWMQSHLIKNRPILFILNIICYFLYFYFLLCVFSNDCHLISIQKTLWGALSSLILYWPIPIALMSIKFFDNNKPKYILKFVSLILCVYFICASIMIFGKLTKHLDALAQLENYKPVIEYLESYKKVNGVYPQTIDTKKSYSEKLHYYQYKTYNNDKDYVLVVDEKELGAYEGFRYCSNKEMAECNQTGYICPKVNNWQEVRLDKWD